MFVPIERNREELVTIDTPGEQVLVTSLVTCQIRSDQQLTDND